MGKHKPASTPREAAIQANEEAVLAFITGYIRERRVSPTLSEIGAATFMSRGNVVRYLDRLTIKGRIERYPGMARGIVLPEADDDGA